MRDEKEPKIKTGVMQKLTYKWSKRENKKGTSRRKQQRASFPVVLGVSSSSNKRAV